MPATAVPLAVAYLTVTVLVDACESVTVKMAVVPAVPSLTLTLLIFERRHARPERNSVQDVAGRHVGTDVARRAVEAKRRRAPGAIAAFQPALVITYWLPVWLTTEASQIDVIVLSQVNDRVQLLMARRAVIGQRDLAAESGPPVAGHFKGRRRRRRGGGAMVSTIVPVPEVVASVAPTRRQVDLKGQLLLAVVSGVDRHVDGLGEGSRAEGQRAGSGGVIGAGRGRAVGRRVADRHRRRRGLRERDRERGGRTGGTVIDRHVVDGEGRRTCRPRAQTPLSV